MSDTDFSRTARKFLDYICVGWTSIVLQGSAAGCVLILLWTMFTPTIDTRLQGVVSSNIPDWIFIGVGIAGTLFFRAVRGKPLIKDTNREELDVIDYLVAHLPQRERNEVFRTLVKKLVEQFSYQSSARTDKRKLLEEAVKQSDARQVEEQ